MATGRLTFEIDLGQKGAIAVLADGFPTAVVDMPSMEVDGRTGIDARPIAVFIREQRAAYPGAEVLGCIERVRAMLAQGRKPGAQSSMNFGDE